MASEFLKSPPHSGQINSEQSWNWLILSEVAEVACPFLVTELLWSSRLVFSSWGTEKLSVLVWASISWVMVRITSLFAIDFELELGDGFCECLLLPQMMSLRLDLDLKQPDESRSVLSLVFESPMASGT